METKHETSYEAGYVRDDKKWLNETVGLIQDYARQSHLRKQYREIFRQAWDALAEKGVPDFKVENMARFRANEWLRIEVFGE